ncbi:MAG: type I methionyl aminopeptidase [Patescibacteria group bacterium]
MIHLKSDSEIKIMEEGGKILAEVLQEVLEKVEEGVSEKELDEFADKLIAARGARPAFKKVDGYKNATCISTNSGVVHGVPTNYRLKKGDVVGVDCGVLYKGFYTDMSETVRVSSQKSKLKSQKQDEVDRFLETGKRALEEAIKQAVLGNRIGHISKTIQEIIEKEGYSVVRSLIGHGVGRSLHEDPEVPGFLDKKIEKTARLSEGMTIAIEIIYNMGSPEVIYDTSDNWTIRTQDDSLSGLFERTVAIRKNGPKILTA